MQHLSLEAFRNVAQRIRTEGSAAVAAALDPEISVLLGNIGSCFQCFVVHMAHTEQIEDTRISSSCLSEEGLTFYTQSVLNQCVGDINSTMHLLGCSCCRRRLRMQLDEIPV